MSIVGKILERVLQNRTKHMMEAQQSKMQRGFTNNASAVNAALLLGTVSGSGTGSIDYGATGPVPDTEPRLGGLSRGPVVCETTTRHV